MGPRASQPTPAAWPTATQVLLCTLCVRWVVCFPQPQSQSLPVRYPGGNYRVFFNETLPRSFIPPPAPSSTMGAGRMVIFPDEKLNPLIPSLDMSGNPLCAGGSSKATFCERVDDYPSEEIRRLVRFDKTMFQDLFGPSTGVEPKRNINADDLSEETVCKHQRQTFFPKMARNNQNFWRYVINDVDYVQAVEAEVCVKEGKACSFVQDSLPGGHQSICRQRFSFKRLLAINPDEKKTYIDSFRFASCCSCYVKVPAEFGRSGRGRPTTQIPHNR